MRLRELKESEPGEAFASKFMTIQFLTFLQEMYSDLRSESSTASNAYGHLETTPRLE